jgi:phosphate:Na+ symporter
VLAVLGGAGLFLFGMQTMTQALRQLASAQARAVLARYTTSPLTGALAGAAVTAVIQSSSATVMTVIGFVGAGLMRFPQAVGVIFGANIGTTVTGWMVAMLGLKLSLGTFALPFMAVAGLGAMLGRGRWAQRSQMLAGFCLVFIGLDMMQGAAPAIQPALAAVLVPADSIAGRLAMVAAGAAVTAVVQSSSVGVAMVLVLLTGGGIDLMQAAALVIGMDIGTTFKSALAAAGASRATRQTAAAHVGYNLVTGLAAFAMLDAVPLLDRALGGDPATALVAFHTLFNLSGAILLLPFAGPFARLVERLVAGGADDGLPEAPDRRLLAEPGAAIDAARAAAGAGAAVLFAALARSLRADAPGAGAGPPEALHRLVEDLEDFLVDLAPAPGDRAARNRVAALLHLTDHLHRLLHRAGQTGRLAIIRRERMLARPARVLAAALDRAAAAPGDPALAPRIARLHRLVAARSIRLRRATLLREHAGLASLRDVFDVTDALRWLERGLAHTERIVHYAAAAAEEDPSRAATARSPAPPGRG